MRRLRGRAEDRSNRLQVGKWFAASNIGFMEEPEPPVIPIDPASRLPSEIMVTIFSHLDLESLIVAGQVCKRWRGLAKMRSLWSTVDVRDTSEFMWVDSILDPSSNLGATFHENMTLGRPSVRRYFRTVMAAPYLRTLALDSSCDITDRVITTILDAPLSQVHTLEFNLSCNKENRLLLKKFAESLVTLKIWNLTEKSVPIINRMKNLKVLHFANTTTSGNVPLFPRRRPGDHGTLVEVRPLYIRGEDRQDGSSVEHAGAENWEDRCHVFQSTVRSLVEAHAETLRVLHLPKYPNERMLSALDKCGALMTLVVPLQPRLAELCVRVPSVRCLTVRFKNFKAPMQHYAVLGQLPPTVEELTLAMFRRSSRLARDFKMLGEVCRGLQGLKRLRVVCVSNQKSIDVRSLTAFLWKGLQRDEQHPLTVSVEHAHRQHK